MDRRPLSRHFRVRRCLPLLVGLGLGWSAQAAPWLDVGDASLKSDVELLAAHGLIDNLTMTWPIPRAQLEAGVDNAARLEDAPPDVEEAARHVRAALALDADPNGLRPLADLQGSSRPDVVRSFQESARNEVDVRGGGEWNGPSTSLRLLAGTQTKANGEGGRFSLDGTAASISLGNALFYGGWVDRWFGPGWTTALSLSNNAPPFPKIGVMRANPHAFESPWLSWIGPWQIDFFVGDLDGPRLDRNTLFGSLRLDFSPVHGLEIGLSRLTEFCGDHHPCNPVNAEFHFGNSPGDQNQVNEEATVDLKYTARVGGVTLAPYVQFMNEDNGPFTHADTSYLGGLSLAGPWGEVGARWRLTVEYADSVGTLNWFDFGKKGAPGIAYNNDGYPDGFRYRDRTLGFSLDSDSRMFSFGAQFLALDGWRYRLNYYHGTIGSRRLETFHDTGQVSSNVVSARPVTFDEGEVGLSIPWRALTFDASLRAADAQAYPRPGGVFGGEISLQFGF